MKTQKKEILWNLINAGLAGGLVFFGSLTSGNITLNGVVASLVAAGVVAITKFKDYWGTQEGEYTNKLFNFIK